MRLDRLLANMGYGTRKEVKASIRKGAVTVNEQVIRDNGFHVDVSTDAVYFKDTRINYKEYIYIMLHKPPGYISATEDKYERTVVDLLDQNMQHFNPYPVGRLDKDTEGLLLLTNDGQLAHELTAPKKNVEKVYYAKISGQVTNSDVEAFKQGVTLEDGYVTKPAYLKILHSNNVSEIEVMITEGKYHQVKRMFLARNKKVTYLKRIQMGEILLDESLGLGEFRELSTEELAYCLSLKNDAT